MFPVSLVQIVAVAAFLVLAALVVKLVLAPGRKRPPTPGEHAGSSLARPEASTPTAEARFQMLADHRLRPLLDAVVVQAAEHGRQASYVRQVAGGDETWRLEVERPELAQDQPRPYIAFSRGDGRNVAVICGGVFPGPADPGGSETENGWRDVDWRDVDRELLHFAERTFRPPDGAAPPGR